MLRVRSLFTGVPGSPYYSNLFFGGNLSTDAQAAVDLVDAFWLRVMVLCAPGIGVTVEPFVASLDPVTGDVVGGFSTTPDATHPGAGAGSPVPASSQLLAQLRTGQYQGGREIRGKFNLPFVTEEHNVGYGVPAPAATVLLQSAFQDFLAATPDIGVWSRKNGAFAQMSSVTISPKWAVLRSRRD